MRKAAISLITTLAIVLLTAPKVSAEIAWEQNLRSAHAKAQQQGKLLLLHFYSDNCTWCERLEQGSFKAPQVGEAISQDFVPVKVHANKSPKLAEMFKVNRFPTDVIVTTEGQTLEHTVSPQDPNRYVAMLKGTLPAKKTLPAQTQIASKPTAPAATKPSAGGKVPGYAAKPEPTAGAAPPTAAVAQIQPPTEAAAPSQLTLPNADLKPGTKAQLAGNRNEGMTLQMPTADTAGNPSPEIALQSTTIESPESGNNVAIAAPVIEDRPEPAPVSQDQPELAMQGFCPVTVINEDKWVEGNPSYGVIHLGKLYLFTNEQNMKTFLADPVPYTPVLNEIDVVRFFEERKIVPGKREWGLKDPIHNRMFFFADEAAMEHFYNEYERYTDAAIEVMEKAVRDANPGT